jgi:RNA polymerase sigma-70 factor (ECF subfamily)
MRPELILCEEKIRHLVLRIANDDEAALKELILFYSSKLFAYALKFTKSREYAEELVQETFVRLWMHRKKLKQELSFNAYLFTIAKHLAYDFLKKTAQDADLKAALLENYIPIYNPVEAQLKYEEYERTAMQAIEQLSPRRQLIYKLSREKGMTYDEIALHLGISRNTVKEQIAQATKSIKEYLYYHTDIVFTVFFLCALD